MSDQMREEFLKWWCSEMHGRALLDEFDRSICQKAWQASRAALVVELPGEIGAVAMLEEYEHGYNSALTECREAITKTGVRVK